MIGILSDAHGNDPAFHRALEHLRGLGAASFVFLGDAVGYIPSPAVVTSLRALGDKVVCVRGNHEDMLLENSMPAEREEIYQLKRTRAALTDDEIQFLRSWPVTLRQEYPFGTVLFVHGSPADPLRGYVYEDTSLAGFNPDADIVFMGHTHRGFVRQEGGRTFVNVGSCGLPRDDGRFGSAALLDETSGAVQLTRFDIVEATAAALAVSSPVHSSVEQLFQRRAENLKTTHAT